MEPAERAGWRCGGGGDKTAAGHTVAAQRRSTLNRVVGTGGVENAERARATHFRVGCGWAAAVRSRANCARRWPRGDRPNDKRGKCANS